MKDRRKREAVSRSRFFWCTIILVSLFGFSSSTFRLFRGSFHPVLVSKWPSPALEAISGDSPPARAVGIREAVELPDQTLIFLNYPPFSRLFTKEDLSCVYLNPNSSTPPTKLSPSAIAGHDRDTQIVRCPLTQGGPTPSLSLKSNGHLLAGPTVRWDFLAYEAVIDRDNSTVVFAKGLNLRPERVSDPTRFECVYGWDLSKPKLVLRSDVLSVAQEIVRCKTPLILLSGGPQLSVISGKHSSILVTVRVKGRGTRILPSVARPKLLTGPEPGSAGSKYHKMCICTMIRNQARFLREWVMYHARIGVGRWFIYDNNSDDDINFSIESLKNEGYNVSRYLWPWIKTQEAGFAHCALQARSTCEWVGFIDVDEFFHLPTGLLLHHVLDNWTKSRLVGEIRTSCHSFGPSGLTKAPSQGVTVGYTCRMIAPERHKSIVRPEALNANLINVVHHFHLKHGFTAVNVNRSILVINHYKYQVWDVFKDKFYRRVATYVADWQEKENAGSKDRTPGLGTQPVEPSDWSTRFCEVQDTALKDRVLRIFSDPNTRLLPWQGRQDEGRYELRNVDGFLSQKSKEKKEI